MDGREPIPDSLGDIGRRFWTQAVSEREFRDAHDLARLEIAARCLDDIQRDQKLVAEQGPYLRSRFGRLVPHPALRTIAENRTCFVRTIAALGLDVVGGGPEQGKLF